MSDPSGVFSEGSQCFWLILLRLGLRWLFCICKWGAVKTFFTTPQKMRERPHVCCFSAKSVLNSKVWKQHHEHISKGIRTSKFSASEVAEHLKQGQQCASEDRLHCSFLPWPKKSRWLGFTHFTSALSLLWTQYSIKTINSHKVGYSLHSGGCLSSLYFYMVKSVL